MTTDPQRHLIAYLLGMVEVDDFLALQRRLVYELGEERSIAALIACEHPPGVTIGREGSRAHIRPNFDQLGRRLRPGGRDEPESSPVRWVSRGGGVMLHLPGQVACYPIIPLDLTGLTVAAYVDALQGIAIDLLRHYHVEGAIDPDRPGVRVNGRRLVHIGVAVRERIAGFGLVVNVNPDLELFHHVQCDGDPAPMTSLRREAPARVRLTGLRHHLVELIAARFGFERLTILHRQASLLKSMQYEG